MVRRLWFIWDIEVVGPGGTETVRVSNRRYIDDSGNPYSAAWQDRDFKSWTVGETGLTSSGEGLVSVVGPVVKEPQALVVLNRDLDKTGTREFAYLFAGGYTFAGNVTGKIAQAAANAPPTDADFTVVFSGRLAKRPEKKNQTVIFYLEPVMADLKSPLLKHRFNGMGCYLDFLALAKTDAGAGPSVLGGSFTLQVFVNLEGGRDRTFARWLDSGSAELWKLYSVAASNDLRLSVKWASGTDTYVLYSLASGYDDDVFFFVTVTWNGTTFDVWENATKKVNAQTISHSLSGTVDTFEWGKSWRSCCRIWSRILTDTEIKERLGVLTPATETNLEAAWEANRGDGDVLTDQSGKGLHIHLDRSTSWESSALHGDPELEGKVYPLLLGDGWAVPVTIYDTRLDRGMISVSLSTVYRVYSQGMPLVGNQDDFRTVNLKFDHLKQMATPVSGQGNRFGMFYTVGQDLSIGLATPWNGTFRLQEIAPDPLRWLRPEASYVDFHLVFDETGWSSSGTSTADVAIPYKNFETAVPFDDYEDNPYATPGNNELQRIRFNSRPADPLFADAVGDAEILSTLTPVGGVYYPPGILDNVLTQAMRKYGPQWSSAVLPSVAYKTLNFRVGIYVSDNTATRDVVKTLAAGCLVWVLEAPDGTITFLEWKFPDEVAVDADIPETSVTDAHYTPRRERDGFDEITTLKVQYARSWTKLTQTSIPDAVDASTRAFISEEWREAIAGDVDRLTAETPIFQTMELRRAEALALGERALRLSRGFQVTLSMRYDPVDMFTDFPIGARVTADLPSFDFPGLDGIVTSRKPVPGSGILHLNIWSE